MIFRPICEEEKEAVLDLYRSVMGGPFCTWDEDYPSMTEIDYDFSHNSLFVLAESDTLLGAISIVGENELDELDCWLFREGSAELARVCISPAWQGQGISKRLVAEAENVLRLRGFQEIHLLAAVQNAPACRCYLASGYAIRSQVEMYEHTYYTCEKKL